MTGKNTLSFASIANRQVEKSLWIIPEVLEEKQYTVLYGDKGAGKSTYICGYVIPEAIKAGIQRIVYVSPGDETTVRDLMVFRHVHKWNIPVENIAHFGADQSFDLAESLEAAAEAGLEDVDDDIAGAEYKAFTEEWALTGDFDVHDRKEQRYGTLLIPRFDLLKTMRNAQKDGIPTLWVCEGLDEVIPRDVGKRYGGSDIMQNGAWKDIIKIIRALLGEHDAFIDVTHTTKGDSSKIKGSTGRYDRTRHAINMVLNREGGSRYTTVTGTGNSANKTQTPRVIEVDKVTPAMVKDALGYYDEGERVPQYMFTGFRDMDREEPMWEALLTLDWSEPVATADIVVALGIRTADAPTANDAKAWDNRRRKMPECVFKKAARGKWDWVNIEHFKPTSAFHEPEDDDNVTWSAA